MEKWRDKKKNLFGWEKKLDDRKGRLYKFTLMPLLNKKKTIFLLKNCVCIGTALLKKEKKNKNPKQTEGKNGLKKKKN